MAKANFVKKSRKAYKDSFTGEEIPAGSSYYWWAFNFGPTYISVTPPKPAQLTQSEYAQAIIGFEETVSGMTVETVVDELETLKGDLENLKSELEDKLSNMPEQLQESSSAGQLLTERMEELGTWISNLDEIETDVDETSIREEVEA